MNEAFEELEDGNEDALKEVLERQKAQLRYGSSWAQGLGVGRRVGMPLSSLHIRTGKPLHRAYFWSPAAT